MVRRLALVLRRETDVAYEQELQQNPYSASPADLSSRQSQALIMAGEALVCICQGEGAWQTQLSANEFPSALNSSRSRLRCLCGT